MRAVNDPSVWWGLPGGAPPSRLSIVEILEAGTLSRRLAAALWTLLEGGASLIVAANPRKAGKTTVLSALLDLLPPDTPAYYTQGLGERFTGLPQPGHAGHPAFLLVNEISDHLPTYLRGLAVQRAFALLDEGYALAATMHAGTVSAALAQLEREHGVPPEVASRCTLILTLDVEPGRHRTADVGILAPGAAPLSLARWDRATDRFHVFEDPAARDRAAARIGSTPAALLDAVDRRETWLQRLTEADDRSLDAVLEAVRTFYASGRAEGGDAADGP